MNSTNLLAALSSQSVQTLATDVDLHVDDVNQETRVVVWHRWGREVMCLGSYCLSVGRREALALVRQALPVGVFIR